MNRQEKQAAGAGNACAGRYAGTDPTIWGWRRPERAEIEAERLQKLARELAMDDPEPRTGTKL